jgi:hypothetical protein
MFLGIDVLVQRSQTVTKPRTFLEIDVQVQRSQTILKPNKIVDQHSIYHVMLLADCSSASMLKTDCC